MLNRYLLLITLFFLSRNLHSQEVDSLGELHIFIQTCQKIQKDFYEPTKYRYIIQFEEINSKDSIWQIFSHAVDKKTCSIYGFRFRRDVSNSHIFPDKSASGTFLISIFTLIYNRRYYLTSCLIDSTGKYLCVWSSRSSGSGRAYNGRAKKVSRRIAYYITKKYKNAKIIKLIKVRKKRDK